MKQLNLKQLKSKIKIKYLTKTEIAINFLYGIVWYFVLSYLFFKSLTISAICTGLVFYHLKKMDIEKKAQMDIELRKQFKEAIYALTSSLSSGSSVERAFIKSLDDISLVYGSDALIVKYWTEIVKKINMNVPLEQCLEEFAGQTDLEEVHSFVSIFKMGKKVGGNLVEIIKGATSTINEKIEVGNELAVLVTQKRYEQKVLSYIIPAMILFFNVFSPQFLKPLYGNIKGQLIMFVCLLTYLFSIKIGKKIVDIKV